MDFFAPILFVVSFYLLLGMTVWIIFSLPASWLNNLSIIFKKWIVWHRETPAKVVTLVALGFLTLGGWGLIDPEKQRFFSLAPELIGISVTILAIDTLYRYSDEKQEKQRTIRQMRSPSNTLAIDAVRIAQDEGWLWDGSLNQALLIGANLAGASLQNASLENANLAVAHLESAFLIGANLKKIDLRGANLEGAHLDEANLQHANLTMARLRGASLISANLRGANLTNCGLQGAHLHHADMRDAILYSADLSYVFLEHTLLEGAKFNRYTTPPADFDLRAVGAIFVDELYHSASESIQ